MDNTLKIVAGVFIAILFASVVFLFVIPPANQVKTHSAAPTHQFRVMLSSISFTGKNVRIVIMLCRSSRIFQKNIRMWISEFSKPGITRPTRHSHLSLHQKLGIQSAGVPEVIVIGNNTPIIGDRDIPADLEGVILEQLKKKQ